jgi:hypothetical protein
MCGIMTGDGVVMVAWGICSTGLLDSKLRSRVDGAGRVVVDSPEGFALSLMDTEASGRAEVGIGVSTSISSPSSTPIVGSEEVVNPISSLNRFSSSFSGAK